MSRGLADTSFFIAQETARRIDDALIPDELAVSIITIGELQAGVLIAEDAEVRARRLSTLADALALDPVPVDDDVAQAWARLRLLLHQAGKRLPANDSWIAATAISLGVPLVTQDDDYDVSIAGLEVIRV